MDAYAQAFSLPKGGNSAPEYEDAFFPRRIRRRRGRSIRFAVADGATETSYSGVWARLLVSRFVRRSIGFDLDSTTIRPLQSKWHRLVHRSSLPWYAEEKLALGAFSSLLGLEFREDGSSDETERLWRAVAFGDTCLVQMRGDRAISAFPLQEASAFTSRPTLLSSLPGESTLDGMLARTGDWHCDDTFFLMTDALACWFFREKEAGNRPWEVLRDLDTEAEPDFKALIESLRSGGTLKNDDVTLLRIDIHG